MINKGRILYLYSYCSQWVVDVDILRRLITIQLVEITRKFATCLRSGGVLTSVVGRPLADREADKRDTWPSIPGFSGDGVWAKRDEEDPTNSKRLCKHCAHKPTGLVFLFTSLGSVLDHSNRVEQNVAVRAFASSDNRAHATMVKE